MNTRLTLRILAAGLLAASAPALAQTTAKDEKALSTSGARSEAEDAKTRKQLEDARQRLDKAAREVAELSTKLGAQTRREVRIVEGGPRRAVLGIQIDPESGKEGVRVLSVSPGGPAADAGLRDHDLIIALDGDDLGGKDPDRALLSKMRGVEPEQKVKLRVLREGKKHDYIVIARPQVHGPSFDIRMPEMGAAVAGGFGGATPMIHQFRTFWPGEFQGLELTTITPKLGAYFGVNEGVLVVQSPADGAFKLEDGDVLQSIDGRKPDDGAHALRILRSYKSGEKLNLNVLRQRKPVTLAVTMPERPEMADVFRFDEPMMAPQPAMPMTPPAPPGARSPGTLE